MDDAQALRLARGAARDYTSGRPDAIDEMLQVLLEDPDVVSPWGPIPMYAMLDVWMALGHNSEAFEPWALGLGYAEAWANLTAQVRDLAACKHENTHMAGFTQVCDDCGQGREIG